MARVRLLNDLCRSAMLQLVFRESTVHQAPNYESLSANSFKILFCHISLHYNNEQESLLPLVSECTTKSYKHFGEQVCPRGIRFYVSLHLHQIFSAGLHFFGSEYSATAHCDHVLVLLFRGAFNARYCNLTVLFLWGFGTYSWNWKWEHANRILRLADARLRHPWALSSDHPNQFGLCEALHPRPQGHQRAHSGALHRPFNDGYLPASRCHLLWFPFSLRLRLARLANFCPPWLHKLISIDLHGQSNPIWGACPLSCT